MKTRGNSWPFHPGRTILWQSSIYSICLTHSNTQTDHGDQIKIPVESVADPGKATMSWLGAAMRGGGVFRMV